MEHNQSANKAKLYQLVLFSLNNDATNVYFVLVLSCIGTFGSNVLAPGVLFVSVMVTGMCVRHHYGPDYRRADGPHQRQVGKVSSLHSYRRCHHGGVHDSAVHRYPLYSGNYAPVGIGISIRLTVLAVIGIREKDSPGNFCIAGRQSQKLKLGEYWQIIEENKTP